MQQTFFSYLLCPSCRGKLVSEQAAITCISCSKQYPLRDGIPFFTDESRENTVISHRYRPSLLRKVAKFFLPPHHSLYFKSLRNSHEEGQELEGFLKKHPDLPLILNIGSLSKNLQSLHPHIINLDISFYPHIDLVADAHQLPFQDESIDMILFKNVLEHVRSPMVVLSEIHRVLKNGGFLYVKIPFLQPFHAVPDDFQRYTVSGMKELFKDYETLEFGISVGPSSAVSWILREYLAIFTSFGNLKLYHVGLIFWGWMTFWIKYMDFFFRKNFLSDRLSSAFYAIYQKKL